jgi:hypothetical protein
MDYTIYSQLSSIQGQLSRINQNLVALNLVIQQIQSSQIALAKMLAGFQPPVDQGQQILDVVNKILAVDLDDQVKIQKILAELLPPPAVKLVVELVGLTKGNNMGLQVADNGKVNVALQVLDAENQPGAAVDAPPTYALSDPSAGDIVAAADGLSAVITMKKVATGLTVTASALAGGQPLSGVSAPFDTVVGAAAALSLSLSAG